MALLLSETGSDASTNSLPRADSLVDEPGAFEGPEKTLEVCFLPGAGDIRGCRGLTRAQLDCILEEARCTILSRMSNAHLDAYVLSESSLFVYAHKVVVKTCGRTTLLRCLRRLVQEATSTLGLQLEWVGYSRKNYCFPDDQVAPHGCFEDELRYLKAHQGDAVVRWTALGSWLLLVGLLLGLRMMPFLRWQIVPGTAPSVPVGRPVRATSLRRSMLLVLGVWCGVLVLLSNVDRWVGLGADAEAEYGAGMHSSLLVGAVQSLIFTVAFSLLVTLPLCIGLIWNRLAARLL